MAWRCRSGCRQCRIFAHSDRLASLTRGYVPTIWLGLHREYGRVIGDRPARKGYASSGRTRSRTVSFTPTLPSPTNPGELVNLASLIPIISSSLFLSDTKTYHHKSAPALLPPNNRFQPMGKIAAILSLGSSSNAFPFHHAVPALPAAEAWSFGGERAPGCMALSFLLCCSAKQGVVDTYWMDLWAKEII